MTAAIRLIIDRSLRKVSKGVLRLPEMRWVYQWSSAHTVDQEPGNERCDEEPSLQKSGHECGHFGAEADAVLEQSA